MRPPILAPAFVLLLAPAAAWSQAVLTGRVVEAGTLRPLAGAHVRWEGATAVAVCDASAGFSLPLPEAEKAFLVVSHTGFSTERRLLETALIGASPVVIALAPKPVELGLVEVRAGAAPEVIYQRTDLHVGAFAVNEQGLWVLAYDKPRLWHREEHAGEKVLISSRLILLDASFRELASIQLPAPARRLVRDHARRVIAEGVEESWLPALIDGELALQRISAETLRDRVLPWTDSIAGSLVGNSRSEAFPAFDHYLHRIEAGRTAVLCSVQDDFMMELFRSQYKYMDGRSKVVAMDLERELGIDRELIAGFMTGFHRHLYFKVPYAPLFRVRDTLHVFDHAKASIRRFTAEGEAIDEVGMVHLFDRAYRRLLVQDAADERLYAVFQRGPRVALRSVDPTTGALGQEQALLYPYPEQVQVHGRHAYYVYRPHGSTQKRTLYREPLR